MIKFRKATQEDLDYVRQNPYESAIKNYPYMQISEHVYTAIFRKQIVAVGGLVIHWPGMAEVWLILTDDCRKDGLYGIIALNAIKDKMEELIKDNKIIRAQATTRTDFPEAIKMIEFFGFKRECLSKKYYPDGSDAYRYARIGD